MNCSESLSKLQKYVDAELRVESEADLVSHLKFCQSCQGELAQLRNIQKALRAIPVPRNTSNFKRRVFARVRAQNQVPQRSPVKWFVTGFSSAAVTAAMAIWLSFGNVSLFQGPASSLNPTLASVELSVSQMKPVHLAFNAPRDFQKVTISLELPKHMELSGFPGQQTVQWQTALSQGNNTLTLPVIAKRATQGEIVARLDSGSKIKEFRIPLRAVAQDA